ncbi:MAG: hypothetical protein WC485_02825 [Opitutaceae bacterium]
MTKRNHNRVPQAAIQEPGPQIVVAVPMERTIAAECALSIFAVVRQGWHFFGRGYGRTDIHRNEFARMLLHSTFTHICMLDSDHVHPPDVVQRLARHVIADRRRLVVGGLNFRRTPPYDPCAFLEGADGRMYTLVDLPPTLMEVSVIGHGAILISREVFEQIPPPWWQYEYDYAGASDPKADWKPPSEDMFFCKLLRAHGIKMWCDNTLTSPHKGDLWIGPEAYQAFLRAHPEVIEQVRMRGHVKEEEHRVEIPGEGVAAGDSGPRPDGRGSDEVRSEAAEGVGAL